METEEEFRRKYETRVLPYYRSGRFEAFSGAGGLQIRAVAFEKKKSAGALVILPGKSETYLKYAEFFYDVEELPLSLYAMDHRGMGFSERPLPDRMKIHVERFDHYVDDVGTFLRTVVGAAKQKNLFVLGHSTGALVAALFMERHPEIFQAGVLCSPFFDLSMGPMPGFVTRLLARLLDRPSRREDCGPGQQDIKRPDFPHNRITNSFPRWSLWEEEIIPNVEAIQFGGVTNHWVRESLEAGHRALRQAGRIAVPLLLLQGEQDLVVRLAAHDRFCRRSPRCTKVMIRGAKHEILIERDDLRGQAIDRIKSFLSERLQQA
jgi:lysophospholipase